MTPKAQITKWLVWADLTNVQKFQLKKITWLYRDQKLKKKFSDFEVENIESEYSSSDSEDELEETTPLDEQNGILAEEVAANSEVTQDINLNEKENIEEVDQKKRNLKISGKILFMLQKWKCDKNFQVLKK